MKRFHVHVSVGNLDDSIAFYSTLFDLEPTVRKDDYAKWMLEDPRVNFAISTRGRQPGVDHLGIQVDDECDLKEISTRLKAAKRPVLEQKKTTCCYARSDKAWVSDPQGIAWESFLTVGEATVYGEEREAPAGVQTAACCAPDIAAETAVWIEKS